MGNADIVRVLSKYGADINTKDIWGTTPLMLSIIGGSRSATEVLLDLGANIDARNVSFKPMFERIMLTGTRYSAKQR